MRGKQAHLGRHKESKHPEGAFREKHHAVQLNVIASQMGRILILIESRGSRVPSSDDIDRSIDNLYSPPVQQSIHYAH